MFLREEFLPGMEGENGLVEGLFGGSGLICWVFLCAYL